MPRNTNAKSAPVLNEADDFEAKLNWILFKQEQDARLWSDPERRDEDGNRVWYPGRPLNRYYSTTPRQMAEVLPDDSWYYEWMMKCKPCGVNWVGDDPCWVCGAEYPVETIKPSLASDMFRHCGCVFCRLAAGQISETEADREMAEDDLLRAFSRADIAMVQRMIEPMRTTFTEAMVEFGRAVDQARSSLQEIMRPMLMAEMNRAMFFGADMTRDGVTAVSVSTDEGGCMYVRPVPPGVRGLSPRSVVVDEWLDADAYVDLDLASVPRDVPVWMRGVYRTGRRAGRTEALREMVTRRLTTEAINTTTPDVPLPNLNWSPEIVRTRNRTYPNSAPEWSRRRPRYER